LFIGRPDLLALWHQYERQQDPEARFVRQLDRLDMALQAVVYSAPGGPDLTEFLDSAGLIVRHPVLAEVFDALRQMHGSREA
jgi:putative hydrolase of HD superfamily